MLSVSASQFSCSQFSRSQFSSSKFSRSHFLCPYEPLVAVSVFRPGRFFALHPVFEPLLASHFSRSTFRDLYFSARPLFRLLRAHRCMYVVASLGPLSAVPFLWSPFSWWWLSCTAPKSAPVYVCCRLARATFRGPDVRTWFEGWLVPSCRRRLVFRRRLVQVVDSSC